ncbi:hypothetical protein [Paenibacillus sp. OK003]|uniref:hypothetical protein n=1 Tax=Paenibacillus sp. OK003 TaxID=1884380 RepID=UPI0008D41553|nr:hypothetical protein [Paenibacillus sp. OK003]SEM07031.1 hypothetical protein SAMN05518856_13339 [Paenibacillus sp. OK003]
MSDFLLYDYLMIYSDEKYIKKIKTIEIEKFFIKTLEFNKISRLKFSKSINNELIIATGLLADSKGSYAFYNLDRIEEINLIEIDIPQEINIEIEESILEIANAIASKFSWIIDERR